MTGLENKRILITGGTSFVGHWLKLTRPKNSIVYCIGRSRWNEMRWFNIKWDAIIHAALVEPTLALQCAKNSNCRLLFVSSGVVYHPEFNPVYSQIKIDGEKECLESGQDVVIARLFTFYGERLDNKKAYFEFWDKAAKNEPIVITGNGNTIRSYMHGRDMGQWIWKVLEKGKSGEDYDVGSDESITIYELAQKIVQQTGSKSEIIIENGYDPMPYYLPENTAKTKNLL